jgi:hypothetical protein
MYIYLCFSTILPYTGQRLHLEVRGKEVILSYGASVGRNSRKIEVNVQQPDDGPVRPKHVVKKRFINKYTKQFLRRKYNLLVVTI